MVYLLNSAAGNENYTVYGKNLLLFFNFQNLTALGENNTRVYDLSPYNLNGTVVGGNFTTPNGKYRRGMQFDGLNDYIFIPSINSTQITFSAWVYATLPSAAVERIIAEKWFTPTASQSWLLDIQTNNRLLFKLRTDTTTSDVYTTDPISFNQWFHVAITYDGITQKIYINGILNNSIPLVGSIQQTPINIFIGTYDSAVDFFNGTMDEIYLYNTALSSSQIETNYYSSLQRVTASNWTFFVNRSGLTQLSYSYGLYVNNSAGDTNQTTLTNVILDYGTQIKAFDETTGGALTFNATFYLTNGTVITVTNQTTYYDINTYPGASVYVTDFDGLYYGRYYYTNAYFGAKTTLNAYLITNAIGLIVRFRVLNYVEMSIINASVNIYANIGSVWSLVSQKLTDYSGTSTHFLNPAKEYLISISAVGYTAINVYLTPTTTDYRIYLTNSNISMVETPFTNLSYYFTPSSTFLNNTPNNQPVSFIISDVDNALAYYRFYIYYNYTLVFYQEGTTASGGMLTATINTSNYSGALHILAVGSFKKAGLDEYNVSKWYGIGSSEGGAFSLQHVLDMLSSSSIFNLGLPITFLCFMIIAVVGSKVTGVGVIGGGVIGLLLFGIFSFINLVQSPVAGATWLIFSLTGVVAIAVLILRGRI